MDAPRGHRVYSLVNGPAGWVLFLDGAVAQIEEMGALADQTSLPWPDEFPRKTQREKEPDPA
jgi:hypothetical protein